MSSSENGESSQSSESSQTGESPGLPIPEVEHTFAQRLLMHVYNTSGIVAARLLPYWENYLTGNADVNYTAEQLREIFFSEIISVPEHYENLPYEVVQYMNPRFNQFQLESLQFGDLVEGEDFQLNVPQSTDGTGMNFEDIVKYISTPLESNRDIPAGPVNLELVNTTIAVEKPPEQESLAQEFARLLSEVVWTDEENSSRPVLNIQELRERVLALTIAGISLIDCLEPNMRAYNLLTQKAALDKPSKNTDQVVPTTSAAVVQPPSTVKRWKSVDDSGLGLSPSKRQRFMTPLSVRAKRQPRYKRMFSTPSHM